MPARRSRSAHASPAGPAPITATRGRFDDAGQIRPPALAQRLVGDRALDAADRHRAEIALLQRAGALAQAILRAHAAADFRQRVGFVHQRGGLEQAALLHQLEPVRNVVVHRALPLAVGVTAVDATLRLGGRLGRGEIAGDLAVTKHANFDRHRARRLSRHIEKLEGLVGHGVTR